MRRGMRRLLRENNGAVLIFVAVAIFALAGMGVLGVDISKLLLTKAQLQNSADAGALAGARLYLDSPIPNDLAIEDRAKRVARMNPALEGTGGDQEIEFDRIEVLVESTPPEGEPKKVTVWTNSRVSQYFTGVVGEALFGRVRAKAVAAAGDLCSAQCLKPWSIPDRHDDFTPFPGYLSWVGNGIWDGEEFTDQNGDQIWQPGEPYVDGNTDNSYNAEFYHPIITGYTAARDHGLQLSLKAGNPAASPEPGQFWPIDLPMEDQPDVGGARYRWNIANCNTNPVAPGDWVWTENGAMQGPTFLGMRELYNKDPNAEWDSLCECVVNSEFAQSPRIGIIPMHDPRVPIKPGKKQIRVTKLAAFFIEDIRGNREVVGRFLRIRSTGEPCSGGETSGGFLTTLSLIE